MGGAIFYLSAARSAAPKQSFFSAVYYSHVSSSLLLDKPAEIKKN